MPLYEYQCDACGRRFELIRKFSDPPLDACPTCGGAVRKLVSSPAFQFKGSGFYITDYGKDGKGPRKEAEAATGDKAAGDKATSDKATGDKATTEKSGADKPTAEKPHKPKAHSKKAKE
jgi:putative FmdB family regulatory protein